MDALFEWMKGVLEHLQGEYSPDGCFNCPLGVGKGGFLCKKL